MEVLERKHPSSKTLGESIMEEVIVDQEYPRWGRDYTTLLEACGLEKGWGI